MSARLTLVDDSHAPLSEACCDPLLLAGALREALHFPNGGEVVVRAGEETGRAFLSGGRVAWITVSTQKKTLSDVLVSDYGVSAQELRAVYAECKASGANFAETLVDWGVLSRATLREALLVQIARGLLQILSWRDARVFVLPADRTYRSSMTFSPDELLAAAEREGGESAHPHLRRMAAVLVGEPAQPAASTSTREPPAAPPTPHDEPRRVRTQEKQMALENFLGELKEVKGYKAAGIMHFTGEMLASDWTGSDVDVNLVGATFNDIFRSSHEACQKIGLDACTEEVINTPKGQVIMRCSGVHAPAHFHMLCILAADGNQALAKLRMEKLVPKVMAELA